MLFSRLTAVWGAASLILAGCSITPRPLVDADRQAEAVADLAAARAGQQPLAGPLTLDEAFARALAYNLDRRVKLFEEAVAQDDVDLSRYDLLPRILSNAGFLTRSNVDASSSRSVITGLQSLEPSTSSDRLSFNADLSASWNILDFGVSYFNARQTADRRLIAEETRRRVVNTLYQDVRRAFWRAAAAQQLEREVGEAIKSARTALADSRTIEQEGLRAPVDALRYQKAVLELLGQLEIVQRELATAKIELASLVNLPPGTRYALAIPQHRGVDALRVPVEQLEQTALLRNPDIREAAYNKRITVDEAHKALLKLLPGLTFTYGPHYDSNSFLVNNSWFGGAIQLSGNLVNLVTLPHRMQAADNAEALADLKREAISLTVIAKLHLAYQEYLSAAKEYEWSDRLGEVDHRIYQQVTNLVAASSHPELERITARVGAVISELRGYESYADAQAALGRLYATIGIDPLPNQLAALDLAGLIREIQQVEAQRSKIIRGEAPMTPGSEPTVPAAAAAASAEAR